MLLIILFFILAGCFGNKVEYDNGIHAKSYLSMADTSMAKIKKVISKAGLEEKMFDANVYNSYIASVDSIYKIALSSIPSDKKEIVKMLHEHKTLWLESMKDISSLAITNLSMKASTDKIIPNYSKNWFTGLEENTFPSENKFKELAV